jgi:putative hydrolase of the HAD superfamily
MSAPFVFFDAAGTLFHLREPVGVGYSRIAENFGFRLDANDASKAFGTVFGSMGSPTYADGGASNQNEAVDHAWWRLLVADVFRQCGADPDLPQFGVCFDALFDHYGSADAWQLFPDTVPALEALESAAVGIGVLSNFDARLVPILQDLGLFDCFDAIAVSSQLGAVKPQQKCYRAAAALANVPPASCVLIGDDPIRDHQAAIEAGFRAAYLVDRPTKSLETIVASILASEPPPQTEN